MIRHEHAVRYFRLISRFASKVGALILAIITCTQVLPAPAFAQATATGDVASDYRLRGLSLTDHNPATSLSLAYDDQSGIYAGGSAVASIVADRARLIGVVGSVGLTQPLDKITSLDVGVSYQNYNLYFQTTSKLRYAEIYAGIIHRDLSGHVYFKPNNPRNGVNSLYSDVNISKNLTRKLRVSAHVGANRRLGGTDARDGSQWRYDTQLAAIRRFTQFEFELSWTGAAATTLARPKQNSAGFAIAGRYFF